MTPSRPVRRLRSLLERGLFAALLALVGQLALGALIMPDSTEADALTQLDAVSILCSDLPTSDDGGAAHRHHATDLALCPLTIALAAPSVVLTPAPVLPAPPRIMLVCSGRERPPACGPPAATARVGEPRAPPIPA